MQKSKILTIFLLIFVFSSIFYSAEEAGHDCTGEDCPICHIIQIAQQNLKLLRLFFSVTVVVAIFKSRIEKSLFIKISEKFTEKSLVALKIRIND